MRWSCPHCGCGLAVSDDKVSTGWSFSRCYKCGGFALIRRSDVNLIKVDRAPAGEPVLLPEANENPTALLSQNATQHLARYTQPAAAQVNIAPADNRKPVIRPAVRRSTPVRTPEQEQAHAEILGAALARQTPRAQSARQASPIQALANQIAPAAVLAPMNLTQAPAPQLGLPEPLPEEPARGLVQRLVPFAIALTGTFVIGSGIYLYVQGQALWEKARSASAHDASTVSEDPPSADNGATPPPAAAHASAPAPVSGTASTTAVATGAAPASTPVAVPASGNEVVQAPSMAPAIAPSKLASADPNRNVVTDEVHARAMAPARTEDEAEKDALPLADDKMKVELLADNVHIHSGPGLKYPVIGQASNQRKYAVEEWKDRWFKISLQNPGGAKTGWVRNDQVRLAR